jgi:hypothetical protein
MCKFCDTLKNEVKIKWDMRSTYADDNVCDYVSNYNRCCFCNGCDSVFHITPIKIDDDVYINIDYHQSITDEDGEIVTIEPFSEKIKFIYCPMCGEQISKDMKDTSDTYLDLKGY